MNKSRLNNERSRDDRSLRGQVSETRKWMQEQGIKEKALNWEMIALEEEKLRWQEHLYQAMVTISRQIQGLPEALVRRVKVLAETAEVSLVTALGINIVDLKFQAVRTRGTRGEGIKIRGSGRQEKVRKSLIESTIPHAEVETDARKGTVRIKFEEALGSMFVVLVPDSQDQSPQIKEVAEGEVRFDGLKAEGRYLLSAYELGEGSR